MSSHKYNLFFTFLCILSFCRCGEIVETTLPCSEKLEKVTFSCGDTLERDPKIIFVPKLPANIDIGTIDINIYRSVNLNIASAFMRQCLKSSMDFQIIFCDAYDLLRFINELLGQSLTKTELTNMSCILKRNRANKLTYASPDTADLEAIGQSVEYIPIKVLNDSNRYGIFRVQNGNYIILKLSKKNERSSVTLSLNWRSSFAYIKWIAETQEDGSLHVQAFTKELPQRILVIAKHRLYTVETIN